MWDYGKIPDLEIIRMLITIRGLLTDSQDSEERADAMRQLGRIVKAGRATPRNLEMSAFTDSAGLRFLAAAQKEL